MIVVDRLEGDRAVLEVDGELIDFPASALPPGTREGAVLVLRASPADTARRLDEARARLERLRQRTPPGADDDEFEL